MNPVVPRVGIGTDIHAFAAAGSGRELWLAGLLWEGEVGLEGHSDADVVAHAACNALFSAAGLGDLGQHFGTGRPQWAGASGVTLLTEACRIVREAGFEIGNVAVQVVGTQTAAGYPEHAQVWDTATRLATVLRAQGARVVLTRADDRGFGPCIDRRAAIGNQARATLVVSIHDDGNLSPRARGFHVIHSPRMAGGPAVQQRSERLAVAVRDAFASGTGMPRSTYVGRGTALSRRTDIGGLNLSTVPAVMLEAGNLRHPRDARLLGSAAFRQREAVALAAGIRRYLGR